MLPVPTVALLSGPESPLRPVSGSVGASPHSVRVATTILPNGPTCLARFAHAPATLQETLIPPITAPLAGFSFEGEQRCTHTNDPHVHMPHNAGRHSAYRRPRSRPRERERERSRLEVSRGAGAPGQ